MEEYEKYKEAGKIAKNALEMGIRNIKEGKNYKELAEEIESFIKERAEIAFPVNISVNNIAAHYTPSINDKSIFKRGDVVKIDVGAHVDGYIADTAKTVEIGTKKHEKLIRSAESALNEAIKIVRHGISIGEIGRRIEEEIKKHGYKPIRNLHGHSLERYSLHAGISIPNVKNNDKRTLKEGQVIAIEPFSSSGNGIVVDNGLSNIYRIVKDSPLLGEIRRFKNLPFADRWLYRIYGNKTYLKLSFFIKRKLIYPYFKLVDNGIVAQAEHTLYITSDGCDIITA